MSKNKTKEQRKKERKERKKLNKLNKKRAIDVLGKVKETAEKINAFINPIKKIADSVALMKSRHFATLAAAFCHKHPQTLIILADPDTDVFFMSYDQTHTVARLLDENGKRSKIVSKAIEGNVYELNHFIGSITGGLDKMKELRKENRERKYKRVIWDREKTGRKFKHWEQIKSDPMEKLKKKEEQRQKRIKEDEIRMEQKKLDKEQAENKVEPLE